MAQKYKIKEEYKKLFGGVIRNNESSLEEWFNCEVTQEALEPVEERELLVIDKYNDTILAKKSDDGWTKQERAFLEFCLNELRSEEGLDELVASWYPYKTSRTFTDWLKQKKE